MFKQIIKKPPIRFTAVAILMVLGALGGLVHGFAAQYAPALNLSDAVGNPGANVTVTLDLANNHGIAGGSVGVAYDPQQLEIVEAVPGTVLAAMNPVINTQYAANQIRLSWASGENHLENGNLLRLTFRVKEGAALASTPLTFATVSLYDENVLPLAYVFMNGSVEVVSDFLSDFDKNGAVDLRDLTRFALSYGKTDSDTTGRWLPQGDFDKNGVLDLQDFINFKGQYGKRGTK